MRRVSVSKYVRKEEINEAGHKRPYWEKVPNGEADFIQWGIESMELDVGSCVDSVALIERDDGFVEIIQPDCIQFLDRAQNDGTD